MGKIYSKEFRECVVKHVNEGMPRKEAVKLFKIGITTLSNWLRWQRERGDLSTPVRGRYQSKRFSDAELISFIEANNDSTLSEIAEHFSVVHNTIWQRLQHLKITRKKRAVYTQSGTNKNGKHFSAPSKATK